MARANGRRARRGGSHLAGGEAESARETEAKVKAAADKINLKIESAEGKIREALDCSAGGDRSRRGGRDAARWSQRLTGITVDSKEAAAAVKAELNV